MELSDNPEKIPGTLRLVAQCLNHYATPGPIYIFQGAALLATLYIPSPLSPGLLQFQPLYINAKKVFVV